MVDAATPDASGTTRRLFASGGVLLVGIALQLGLGFLARVVVARSLGSAGYGAIALGLTLLTVASVVVVAGMDVGVGRYLPRFDAPSARRGVLVSAFRVAVPLSVAAGGALVLLAEPLAALAFHDPATASVLRAFGLAVPFAAVLRLAVGSARGLGQSLPKVLLQNVVLPVARLLLVVVAVVVGVRWAGVAWAYAGAYAVAAAGSLVYLRRHSPLFDGGPGRPMARALLGFSAPLMVVGVMNVVFGNVDTLLLGALAPLSDVGVYNVAYPLAALLTTSLTAFGFLFMPTVSRLHADGRMDELARTYQVVSKWVCFATLPGVLLFATHPGTVIGLTFGTAYAAGGATLALLSVGFFTHAVTGPSGNVLTALGRSRTILYDNVAVAAVNVGLNLVLIPRYGILGAAAATAVGYALMNGLYLAQLYRDTGMHPFRRAQFVPGVAAVALWVGLVVVGGRLLGAGPGTPVAETAAFLVGYPVVLLAFGGVEPEDVALLDAVEDRLDLDLGVVRALARRLAA